MERRASVSIRELDGTRDVHDTSTRKVMPDAPRYKPETCVFRRFLSVLSPGMELIRIVNLQQLKADAEARYERLAV